MAEDPVVKEYLSKEMVEAGEGLVRELDRQNWPVEDALWLYNEDRNRWQLVIASPKVESDGSLRSYEVIRDSLQRVPQAADAMSYFDVTVRSPSDRLIEAIGRERNTGPGIHRRRFRGAVGGQYVDDALLYRST
ncbi:MAG: hypothetical protein WD894_25500 [Pirellulales bacterium]